MATKKITEVDVVNSLSDNDSIFVNSSNSLKQISKSNLVIKGDTGKSAYAYAQEGGYTGTEAEFAEKLAQEQLTGTTGQLTPTQVYNAVSAGIPVKVQYTDSTYGLLSFTAFNVAESLNVIVSQTIVNYNDVYILAELNGNKSDNTWGTAFTTLAQKTDIPSVLPNPNALTFTGAVTGSYDGSEALSVNIPTVPTKTSQLTNDSGFLTRHQDISGKQDKSTLEADVAAKGFTKNTGTYNKPAGGIPKTDLAAAVQTSLGKADTALQTHQSLAAYRKAAEQDVIDNTKLTDAPTDGKEYARKNGNWHEIAVVDVGVEKVNGKTGVVTLNATEIPSTKFVPKDTISFLIDGAFDEELVELKRNGASASANDFIAAVNSGSTVTVSLHDQGNPKVMFDDRPVKYKITGDTLSLCFIAEAGHQYTPAIYVLSGTTGGATVSTLVEHNFTDSFYQENYVSANDLPVQAPLSVEEYLEALDATNQSIITDLETIRSGSTPATVEKLGLVRIGENLKITKDGILSVDTANAVEQDNTKPITSAAVHAAIGNIEVLLAAL